MIDYVDDPKLSEILFKIGTIINSDSKSIVRSSRSRVISEAVKWFEIHKCQFVDIFCDDGKMILNDREKILTKLLDIFGAVVFGIPPLQVASLLWEYGQKILCVESKNSKH